MSEPITVDQDAAIRNAIGKRWAHWANQAAEGNHVNWEEFMALEQVRLLGRVASELSGLRREMREERERDKPRLVLP